VALRISRNSENEEEGKGESKYSLDELHGRSQMKTWL
jgi:hypothetical protein